MLKVTARMVLPTTMVGSYPRPLWFTESLGGRSFKQAMGDTIFREQYTGATRRAEELGYKLDHFWLTEPGMTAARATQILRTRNITGLASRSATTRHAALPSPDCPGSTHIHVERGPARRRRASAVRGPGSKSSASSPGTAG